MKHQHNEGFGNKDHWSTTDAEREGDRRLEAIATIGPSYKKSRKLLAELDTPEDTQASHMLCVALGAIAMQNLGIDDPEWLIDETARRLPNDDYARLVGQADVRAGLRNLYRDMRRFTADGDIGNMSHLCQFALIHHFADYDEAAGHPEAIVTGVADMVAHATMASIVRANLSGRSPSFTSQPSKSGCMAFLFAGVVAARAVDAWLATT